MEQRSLLRRLQRSNQELFADRATLQNESRTDSLTGLANRRRLEEALEEEWGRARRAGTPLSCIMLDIDHFKRINDGYGHDTGDAVLKKLALIFESAIRTSDSVARWGGEEFLICCTTIDEQDLLPIAETIRKLVANTEFDHKEQITASLGCAAIVHGETIGELIKRADIALYEAKNNGRNQSVVSEFTDISLP